jgi:hypothetical protein
MSSPAAKPEPSSSVFECESDCGDGMREVSEK